MTNEIIEAEERPMYCIDYEKHIARTTILDKYSFEEQLNIMRQAIVGLCKAHSFEDGELFNMHGFINDALGRTENEDIEPKAKKK